jgi:hypothetical protein
MVALMLIFMEFDEIMWNINFCVKFIDANSPRLLPIPAFKPRQLYDDPLRRTFQRLES